MDGSRFDDLSRKLAGGYSRRVALKGVATGLLGALGLRRAAGAQVSQAQCGNTSCRNNPGKCNDGCVCCVYGNGNSRCRPPGSCGGGAEICPDGEVVDQIAGCVPVVAGNGSLDESDPFSACFGGRYDTFTFEHAGGPLSVAVRGADSRGGSLPDPFLILYAGTGLPVDCEDRLDTNDDGGCGLDAYLETTQLAGTYTVGVAEFSDLTGTYTFERDTFTGTDVCP